MERVWNDYHYADRHHRGWKGGVKLQKEFWNNRKFPCKLLKFNHITHTEYGNLDPVPVRNLITFDTPKKQV